MAFIGRKLRWDPYVTAKLRVACTCQQQALYVRVDHFRMARDPPRASQLPRWGLGARTRGNLCTDGSTTRAWCPGRRHHPSPGARAIRNRSEEHTSELQSHHDLVCRLLLE